MIFYYIYVPRSLYPFIYQWTPRLSPCPVIVNTAAMNTEVHIFLSIIFSGYMPSNEVAGLYGSFPGGLMVEESAFSAGDTGDAKFDP